MLLQTFIAVLVVLQSSYVSTYTIPCNVSDELKQVTMTPLADTEFENVYNICDRVRINLPPGPSDCNLQNQWRRLPDLTTDSHQTVLGKGSYKDFTLDMPSQFGVYCAQQCNDPNQEYCSAIAVSPTFDLEEAPNCTVLHGKTVQLSCISIGYPIVSNIMTKGSNGEDIDACPPMNSTANFAYLGNTKFGKLNHTCNYTLPDFGIHEFVCTIAFLPWDALVNFSFSDNRSVYCNVTEEIVVSEDPTSTSFLQKMDHTPSVSNTHVTTTITATILPVLSVILLTVAVLAIGVTVIIRKKRRTNPVDTVELRRVRSRNIETDSPQADTESRSGYVEHDGIDVRKRH